VRVVTADGPMLTVDATEPAANAYGAGRLRWLSGPLCGLDAVIARSSGATLTLRQAPRALITADTRVEIIEGCDKTIATCSARFGNAVNFRGEPYLPGIDLLTRYPGA